MKTRSLDITPSPVLTPGVTFCLAVHASKVFSKWARPKVGVLQTSHFHLLGGAKTLIPHFDLSSLTQKLLDDVESTHSGLISNHKFPFEINKLAS